MRPNIVVVLADDLGWGELGCYGSAIATPHIDALAAGGIRATDCHSASSTCTASRYALMTGRYAWRGPLKSTVLTGQSPALTGPGLPTLASALKQAGYAAGAFGSWHLGPHDGAERNVDGALLLAGGPLAWGFDRFFGVEGSVGQQAEGFDQRCAAEAVRFIEGLAADTPLLCYLAPSAPARDRADDAVRLVDRAVGQLTQAIAKRGQEGNTLVIVASDNGAPVISFDDPDAPGQPSNGGWRGQKGDLWDGGHRVPFIARWPGQFPAGVVLDTPICLTDVLPTVAAAAGANTSVPDGFNQLSALMTGIGDPSRAIVHHSLGGRFALRQGRWKAIFAQGSGGGHSEPWPANPVWDKENPRGQLYDLSADPAEAHDLWDAQPDVVRQLYAKLQRICVDESSGLAFGVPL